MRNTVLLIVSVLLVGCATAAPSVPYIYSGQTFGVTEDNLQRAGYLPTAVRLAPDGTIQHVYCQLHYPVSSYIAVGEKDGAVTGVQYLAY